MRCKLFDGKSIYMLMISRLKEQHSDLDRKDIMSEQSLLVGNKHLSTGGHRKVLPRALPFDFTFWPCPLTLSNAIDKYITLGTLQ